MKLLSNWALQGETFNIEYLRRGLQVKLVPQLQEIGSSLSHHLALLSMVAVDMIKIAHYLETDTTDPATLKEALLWLERDGSLLIEIAAGLEEPLKGAIDVIDERLGESLEEEEDETMSAASSERPVREANYARIVSGKLEACGVNSQLSEIAANNIAEVATELSDCLVVIDKLADSKQGAELIDVLDAFVEVRVDLFMHALPNHLLDMRDESDSSFFLGLMSNIKQCLYEMSRSGNSWTQD